jgi:steroid delta-isomerase-like uncharacterized protein
VSIQENIRLDEEMNAAINAHDVERLVALVSEDVFVTNTAQPAIRGNEAFGQYFRGTFETFPDYAQVVKNRVVSEDQVATEIEFSGTQQGPLSMGPGDPIPATGKKIAVSGAYFLRIQNGKMVEVHQHPDMVAFLMQLGLMPGPG